MYVKRLTKIHKSLRTKVFGFITPLLAFMATRPDDAKIVLGEFVSQEFINAHWATIVIVVSMVASGAFAHGAARQDSTIPIEER